MTFGMARVAFLRRAAYAPAAMTPPSLLAAGSAAAPRSAVRGWGELVRSRREQMEGQLAAMGGPPEDWWAERSAQFARGIGQNAIAPPLGLAA
ncbi:MAG: hypothetical protein QF664_12365, partial [Dehalococcoidia bacterium]|nr:hypothetical protein [Dehalococcoidia bacterium]